MSGEGVCNMVSSDDGQALLEPTMRRGSDALIAIGIFAVAVLVRGVYLAESSDNPTFGCPIVDSSSYHTMAAELALSGKVSSRYFWQPFFYPFFLSVIYRFAGPSVLAAKLVQVLLGSGTACCLGQSKHLIGIMMSTRKVTMANSLT